MSHDQQNNEAEIPTTSFIASLVPILLSRWKLVVLAAVLPGCLAMLLSATSAPPRKAAVSISIGSVPGPVHAAPQKENFENFTLLEPLDQIIDWGNSRHLLRELIPDDSRRRRLKLDTHVLSPTLLRFVAVSSMAEDAQHVVTEISKRILTSHEEKFARWYSDAEAVAQALRNEVNTGKEQMTSLEVNTPSDSLALFAERRELAALERQAATASLALNPIYARRSYIVAAPALQDPPEGSELVKRVVKATLVASVLGALAASFLIFLGAQVGLRRQE